MADNLTDFEERRLLDLSIVSGSVYLALYTVAPTDAGGGTEVTGGGYVRQAIVAATAAATDGGGNTTKSNTAAITFPAATAVWGTIVAVGVVDAATAGNLRWWRPLSVTAPAEQRTIGINDQYTVAVGALTFQLT